MATFQQMQIMGNLGKAPSVSYVGEKRRPVANLSVATHERWEDGTGEWKTETTWHRVVVWGRDAEACAKFLQKGSQVLVIGKLKYRTFTDKEGKQQNVVEILATEIKFCDRRPSNYQSNSHDDAAADDTESRDQPEEGEASRAS